MKKRFSEEQIIRILKEAEAIGNVREVCRQHNIAEQTLFRWRRRFGAMETIACCETLSQKSAKPGCQALYRGILAADLQRERAARLCGAFARSLERAPAARR